MRYLIFILLLSSCASMQQARTYKAYKRVAADPFVDEREGALLSQKCITSYPVYWDTPTVIIKGIDSADYEATISAFNDLLDKLMTEGDDEVNRAYNNGEEFSLFDTSKRKVRAEINRRIKEQVSRPVSTVVKIPYRTTVNEETLTSALRICRAETAALQEQKEQLVAKLRKRKNSTSWLVVGGLALGIISFFGGKIIKV